MSVSVTISQSVLIQETLALAGTPTATSPVITHDGMNITSTYNAGSIPGATACACNTKAMTAGTGTIDLTAVAGTNNAVINANATKVQIFKVRALPGNSGAITIKAGATNPYNIFGTSWIMSLTAGADYQFFFNNAAPTIGASAKTIDMTGTTTDGIEYEFVFG